MDPQVNQDPPQKGYIPYDIAKTNTITPDNPAFHSFLLNLVIFTKYGDMHSFVIAIKTDVDHFVQLFLQL